MASHRGDDLEDDFVLDEIVAYSDDGHDSGLGDDEDVGKLLSADEGEAAVPDSKEKEEKQLEKKRKRKEKLKEKKVKVRCTYVRLCDCPTVVPSEGSLTTIRPYRLYL